MYGPSVNTEAKGLEEQDAEAEAAISVSTSTEAAAQELEPQDAAVGTPTQIRSRDAASYCIAPTRDAATMSTMLVATVHMLNHGT